MIGIGNGWRGRACFREVEVSDGHYTSKWMVPQKLTSELATTHPHRALRHKSLVPPCFVNQLLDRFAWSVNDRSRSNVSSFDGRHAQEKGRRPSR